MLATYAASRHRQIVPCCMISSVSHHNVSCLVTDRSMCFATALDKAFENIDCMSAILRCQAKNRFYESTQRLIQPRRVLWSRCPYWPPSLASRNGYDVRPRSRCICSSTRTRDRLPNDQAPPDLQPLPVAD